ncbi:hypothetical protein PACILC2_40480 [Paenibacillus cisolokensis]|uniref:type I site-specific deoxyribonuclease n=1 Tax=Paenibacillus cisolokensis TaxID=1658519 RepID=A0ABQ4NBB8_9BACL|nr:hypothetical protein PACILC2_40480 [Paenibacillus cisolokensis]
MAYYTTSYTESDLEQAALEWFEELNYEKAYGPDISPEGEYPERQFYHDVILKDRLRDALIRINKRLPREAIEEAIRIIEVPRSPSLLINNKAFQKMITDGIDVQYRAANGEYPTEKVWLFDTDPDRIGNNDFLVVNQFTVVENQGEKRPDIVVFVNGLPIAVLELKSASNEEVGISDAYNQMQSYKSAIPSLFTYNSFLVISDGVNARVGTLTANEDRFMMWRTIDGDDVAPSSLPQLEVLIKGMFEKAGCSTSSSISCCFRPTGSICSKYWPDTTNTTLPTKRLRARSERRWMKGTAKSVSSGIRKAPAKACPWYSTRANSC